MLHTSSTPTEVKKKVEYEKFKDYIYIKIYAQNMWTSAVDDNRFLLTFCLHVLASKVLDLEILHPFEFCISSGHPDAEHPGLGS